MKVFLDRPPRSGPWGGGNRFSNALCQRLKKENIDVVFDLQEDLDLIFCMDPRPGPAGLWYQDYLNFKVAKNTPIMQRVGDAGTHGKPELTSLVKQSTSYSDFVVFPSEWAKDYIEYEKENFAIIQNRSDSIFKKNRKNSPVLSEKPSIVTHHWSTNPMKGFETYRFLDDNMGDLFDFTYIGRLPEGFEFKNASYIPPISKEELCEELPKHDIYFTASKLEAGANHVLEAMVCGLPVVYTSEGGSIPEYCSGFGVEFTSKENAIPAIINLLENYKEHVDAVSGYDETIELSVEEYVRAIWNLLK